MVGLATRLGEAGIEPAAPAFARSQPAGDGFDVTAGFGVPDTVTAPPGLERMDIGGCEAAHTTHLGPYTDLPSACEDLRAEAARLGRAVDAGSPMWEEYWSGPDTPEEQTRTEVYWPVSEG
jgi:effector-binding domain-containing protein